MGPLKTTSDSFKWGRAKAINMSSCKLNEPCIIKSLSTFRSSTRVESGRVYGLIVVMYIVPREDAGTLQIKQIN